ncbi:MAG: hypothetical protein COW30_11760 [Rhodospirillales bacterium CG15_BIG_FIL_POST_REV_8_21_14_020_66_15]|nr:MAG: hypothetical protein COW30_11760 [Rhodospirillales bacterium CG15_BIG_FIL_POST_REV_8_21_14_020_66_15]
MDMPSTIDDINGRLTGRRTRRVWDYWRDGHQDGRAPGWGAFNLMDVYRDAPICLVLDVLRRPGLVDYRYRFVGTMIVQYRWKLPVPDHTGLTFYEARHQYDFSEVKGAYDRCAESGLPILMQRNFDAHDASGTHERLILPLTVPDGDVDKLVVVVERLRETKKTPQFDPPLF